MNKIDDTYMLGHIIGPELLNREFKELYLQNIDMFFESDEIYNFLYKNMSFDRHKWDNMVNHTINRYINKYVPKYTGIFSKAGISGKLYIGVDDYGFIEGIPYYGKLTSHIVKNMIMSNITNSRGISIDNDDYMIDHRVLAWYYCNLEVKVIKLDTSTENIEAIYEQNMLNLAHLEKLNNVLEAKWNHFAFKYKEWHSKLTKYSGKLVSYLLNDDMFDGLMEYIKNDFTNNPSFDQSKLESILAFFNQDKKIFSKMQFSIDVLEDIIKNPYSPIKWLVNYKDSILHDIKKIKPRHPDTKPDSSLHFRFTNKISNIKAHLMKSSDINFYLIKINIPNMPDAYLEYRYSEFSPWISKSRVVLDNGPSCI